MKNVLKGMVTMLLGMIVISNHAQAQQKEVIIEKKSKKPYVIKSDSVRIKKNDNEENITVIINGDKVTINGKETDLNDPRLKITKGFPLVSVTDSIEMDDPMMIEEMMAPPPPSLNKAFLGVLTENAENGIKVIEVVRESPAAKANIKENDIIVSVNDDKIETSKDLFNVIGKFKPEDKIKLTINRDGKKSTIDVILEKNMNTPKVQSFNFTPGQGLKMPPMPNGRLRGFNFTVPDMPGMEGMTRANSKPKIGISVEDLEEGKGVKIKDVKKDSPAEKSGLKTGDIITKFDNKNVEEVNDIKWSYFQPGQNVSIEISRGKEKKVIEVKIPKKINSADL
jgi:serine protease Do